MRFPEQPPVTFAAVAGTRAATKALDREHLVTEFRRLRRRGHGIERALQLACSQPAPRGLKLSPGRLRVWIRRHRRAGLNGLVDQKLGIVGRKSIWARLSRSQRIALLSGRVVFGSFAPAFRALARRDDLSAEVRASVAAARNTSPRSVRRQGAEALARLQARSASPLRPARRRSRRGNRRHRGHVARRHPQPPVSVTSAS